MKHKFVSTKPAAPDPTKVGSVEWDQPHVIVGTAISSNTLGAAPDDLILATGGVSGITYTPFAGAADGTVVMVMKVDAGAGAVTVLGTINGSANFVLTNQWQLVELRAQGGAWQVLRGPGSNSGAVLLSPSGDQTIVGPHALILNGGALAVSGAGKGTVAGSPTLADFRVADGNSDWLATYRAANGGAGEVLTIEQDGDGDFFISVYSADGVTLINQIIMRGIANGGNVRFGKDATHGIAVDASGNVLIGGQGSGAKLYLDELGGAVFLSNVLNFAFAQILGANVRGQSTFQLPNLASSDLAIESFTLMAEVAPPANASAAGATGQYASDAGFVYRCVAPNTWKRAALSTW